MTAQALVTVTTKYQRVVDDAIPRLEILHPSPDFDHYSRGFMSQDGREL
jgi:hypothetical protein